MQFKASKRQRFQKMFEQPSSLTDFDSHNCLNVSFKNMFKELQSWADEYHMKYLNIKKQLLRHWLLCFLNSSPQIFNILEFFFLEFFSDRGQISPLAISICRFFLVLAVACPAFVVSFRSSYRHLCGTLCTWGMYSKAEGKWFCVFIYLNPNPVTFNYQCVGIPQNTSQTLLLLCLFNFFVLIYPGLLAWTHSIYFCFSL